MLAHPAIILLIDTDLNAANGYETKMSPTNHTFPLAESQHNVINPTNPGSALDDGIEHWLDIGRRTANNAEHLGGSRLMLQGLSKITITDL